MIAASISPNRTIRRRLKVICCLILTAANLKVIADDWSFDVNPYLSAVAFDTETTLPALPPRTPAGVDRFETGITGTAMHGKN